MVEIKLYARFEVVNGLCKKQYLADHLVGTRDEVIKCLNIKTVRCVVKKLSSDLEVKFKDVLKTAELAALLHDVGKCMYYYQKQVTEIENFEINYMNFKYHEVVSAYIIAKAFNYLKQTTLNPPWLQSLIVQAVLMHHQGLRSLVLEKFCEEVEQELNKVIKLGGEKSVKNIEYLLKELHQKINVETLGEIIKVLPKVVENIVKENYHNLNIIIHYYNLHKEERMKLSRIITGCLMIADVTNAHKTVGGTASKYVKDILKTIT